MIQLALDETSFRGLGAAALDDESRLLANFMVRLREVDRVSVVKKSDVWIADVTDELKVCDIAFTPGLLDEDVRQLFYRVIDSLPAWDGEGELRTSRDFATSKILEGEAWGCVVPPSQCSKVAVGDRNLHLIGTISQAIEFYRAAIELGDFAEECFIQNCQRAFPNLYMRAGIENEIARFSMHYKDGMRLKLTRALSDLNDILPDLLLRLRDLREIARQFDARSEFSISPESPLTRRNAAAMRQRDVVFDRKLVRCEWHLKIEPQRDRIHFSFAEQDVAPGRILVGIFTEHLLI